MHINCKDIEQGFVDYLSGDKKGLSLVEKSLSSNLKKNVKILLVPAKKDAVFIMSVSPDKSVVSKISQSLTGTESRFDAISDLWKKCNNWTLNIDERIFDFLNASELTALIMHETGHMLHSDSVPKRISDVIQFSLATGKISHKAVLSDNFFQKILAVPVLSACQFQLDRSALKNEIRADRMATYNGYLTELMSALDKVENFLHENKADINKDVSSSLDYVTSIIDNIEYRKDHMVKHKFHDLQRKLPIGLMKESVDEVYESWYPNDEDMRRFRYISDSAEKLISDAYFTEFGFGGKKLAPIEQNQLDYIRIKVESIQTINDKMMIVSYINGKLELIHFYREILQDPKMMKKYKVPHNLDTLNRMEDYLNKTKEFAINTKLPTKEPGIYVNYPAGYEG